MSGTKPTKLGYEEEERGDDFGGWGGLRTNYQVPVAAAHPQLFCIFPVNYGATTAINLGPLHTQAKSRDHETVRAQKKVSKRLPNTLSKSCTVVTDPQV